MDGDYSGMVQSPISAQPIRKQGGGRLRKTLSKRKSHGQFSTEEATGAADPDSFERGGVVRRTGMAKVHKGERVLTRAQAKRYAKRMRPKRSGK